MAGTTKPRPRATRGLSAPIVPAAGPAYHDPGPPACDLFVGDCRGVIPTIPECARGAIDLIFADPPFNWNRAYDRWNDAMSHADYLDFTYRWLDLCVSALSPRGSLWVNIPDDWAAEIVVHLKAKPGLALVNWCIWHYRFGQNRTGGFINSKVHVLHFARPGFTWNPGPILEVSDRASTYFDPRTMAKRDGMPAGLRVPMDVWYGPFLGRVQGNNKERRGYHDNQLPEAYLHRVIASTSNPGDVLMDPFNGSGTTGVVARAMGRRYIGIEYSPETAASAWERILAGPARPLPDKPISTAIFTPRKAGDAARKRFKDVPGLGA